MRRMMAVFAFALTLALHASPASAAVERRVVVVTIDGTRLGDWVDAHLPAFTAIFDSGAAALLSTRTATFATGLPAARQEAYRALGSGRFSSRGDPSALAIAAERGGRRTEMVAASKPGPILMSPAGMTLIPQRADPSFPTGRRTNYAAAGRIASDAFNRSDLLIVGLDDPARIDAANPADRDRLMRVAMADADRFIGFLRSRLAADDVLIVASLTPPQERQRLRRFLTTVAIVGGGTGRGLLTSDSTRRSGVVTIADLAPTILRELGVEIPPGMTATPATIDEADDATPALRGLETDLLHSASVRKPLLKSAVFFLSALVVIGALTSAAASARGSRRTLPHAIAGTGSVVVFAVPLAILLEPLYGTSSSAATIAAVAAAAVATGGILRRLLGSVRAIAVLAASTLGVVFVDLLVGGQLSGRSPLSFSISEGARFHGIGNDVMGLVIASAIVLSALWLERDRSDRRTALVAVFLVALVAAMVAPTLGAKFGSVPTALPAFAVLVLYAAGLRLTLVTVLGIAIVTILGVDLVIAADALRGSGSVADALGSGAGELIARKARSAGRLLALSYWAGGLIACAASVALLLGRGPHPLRRRISARPDTERVLVSCGVAAVLAIAFNDAGVTAAAWIAFLASAFLIARLLEGDAKELSPAPRRVGYDERTAETVSVP